VFKVEHALKLALKQRYEEYDICVFAYSAADNAAAAGGALRGRERRAVGRLGLANRQPLTVLTGKRGTSPSRSGSSLDKNS
jgi:hypothetical protein